MKIAVIDGQGGGLGKSIVEALRDSLPAEIEIIALGTNSLATGAMLRAGASVGATGENAICVTAPKVDIIIGPMGIIVANSMLGELTPAMATAIASSPARKFLIPTNRCNVHVVGYQRKPLTQVLQELVWDIKSYLDEQNAVPSL